MDFQLLLHLCCSEKKDVSQHQHEHSEEGSRCHPYPVIVRPSPLENCFRNGLRGFCSAPRSNNVLLHGLLLHRSWGLDFIISFLLFCHLNRFICRFLRVRSSCRAGTRFLCFLLTFLTQIKTRIHISVLNLAFTKHVQKRELHQQSP